MPKLKNVGSPGRNLKSFFQDRTDLLGDDPAGSTSRKNRVPSRPPRVKPDDTKRDHRPRSNLPKAARTSGSVQQSERSKKKEVASNGSKGTAARVNPTIVDKDYHPKDLSEQSKPAANEVGNEPPQGKLDALALHKGKNDDKQHGNCDLVKEVLNNAPPSDPICCFTSDDEEMLHASTRKAKRPFEEVNLDLKAGEHGSPEDQKRRNSGPPILQNLHIGHTVQEKEKESSVDAARLRASVETDLVNDLDLHKEVCQTTKLNESEQLLAKQQTESGQNETSEAQTNGGYGVISLFDGVSSVVPTLTRKFGYALVVAILAENDIDVRAVVCAEFGYRADEQWSFTPQGTAALYVKDVHTLIAKNCQVLRNTIEAYPDQKWIITGGSPCQDLTFAGPYKGLLGLAGPCSRLFFVFLCIIFSNYVVLRRSISR